MNCVGNKFNLDKSIVGNWEVATIAQMVTLGFSCSRWWQCYHMVLGGSSDFVQILPPLFQQPCHKGLFYVVFWRFFTQKKSLNLINYQNER
jgi:hypothetical protein